VGLLGPLLRSPRLRRQEGRRGEVLDAAPHASTPLPFQLSSHHVACQQMYRQDQYEAKNQIDCICLEIVLRVC